MSRALEDLRTRLLDLEADLGFVAIAARLRPRFGDVVNWTADGDAIKLAQDFMGANDQRIEGLFGPLFVRLMAALERFARSLVVEALGDYARSRSSYDQVPEQIKNRNIALTGSLLASIDSPREYPKVSFEDLINNLATCQTGNTSYRLNALAFAAVFSGAGPPTVERALGNLGLRDIWTKLGADAGLAKALGTKGAKQTATRTHDRLQELWRWRNNLAHGGDEEIALTEVQLRECLAFVRVLCAALDGETLKSLQLASGSRRG